MLKAQSIVPSGSTIDSPTFTGNIQNGVRVFAARAIPFIYPSSFTMGNNGAVSAMTALPQTYSDGAWFYLQAGDVAAGVPASAGWYWFVASSTTAGTVYNSQYTAPGVPGLGTTTAFSTTGPGARTGPTGEVVAVSMTVAANSIGANGQVKYRVTHNVSPNNANAKTPSVRMAGIGGPQFGVVALASNDRGVITGAVCNTGQTNRQRGSIDYDTNVNAGTNAFVQGTIDTTASTTIDLTVHKATATDNDVLQDFYVEVIYQP